MRILFLVAKLAVVEPFGIMCLIPHLKQRNHDVFLAEAEDENVMEQVAAFKPDVIGYSVCTGSHKFYLGLNRILKEHFTFISVFGGPHPTFFPNVLNDESVDAICRGEGDQVFADFCDRLQATGIPEAVPNFSVRVKGRIVHSRERHFIQDLDALPFPDRSVYYAHSEMIRNHPVKTFVASRGCPFSCSYCFNHAMDQLYSGSWKHVRVRTPANLVSEIADVTEKYPVKFLAFRESIFPLDKQWLRDFAVQYKERIGLPFYAHARLDMLDEENTRLLAAAGCYSVNVGIETGNPELRTRLLQRRMTNQKMIESSRLLRKAGIRVIANNMLGLPGGSFENDLETLRLSQQCRPDYSLAMIYQPYPGTRLADEAVQLGCFDGNYEKISFTYYDSSPLTFRTPLEKRRIENLHKLFGAAAMFPALTPFVRLLTYLPQNRIFRAIFSTLYLVFHQSEIFPHGKSLADWKKDFMHILRST